MTPGVVTAMVVIMLVFIAVACIAALEMKDLLSSVIAIGAAGFGLSIVDLLLRAPDLALTQVAVEILCLVILIRVVVTRRDETFQKSRGTLALAVVLVLGGLFLAVCFHAFDGLREFGNPSMMVAGPYLERGLAETGAPNAVMSVLLDFRAYDTLGEATVIFAAIVGALAVLRKVGRIRVEGHEPDC